MADDGRWAAIFLANFHFTATGTNYLTSTLPPSPLQNFWSLAVEEQFYIVFPTLVLLIGAVGRRFPFRIRLGAALVAIIVGSYAWSIVQTAHDPVAAYFSPFTRAWELALGALVALATPLLKKVPVAAATVVTWAGLAAIVASAFVFNHNTAYPGSLVAVPVVGAAAVIGGGTVVPAFGAERLLAVAPFAFIGRLSYSWYLWHYPILIVATEHQGPNATLALGPSLLLVLLALGVAAVTYRFVENPIRHLRISAKRSVAMGAVLIAVTLVILSLALAKESYATNPDYTVHPASLPAVLHAVATASSIKTVPGTIEPSVAGAPTDWGGFDYPGCEVGVAQSTEPTNNPNCTIGDKEGTHEIVVWGDSHALMWLPAFDTIAKRAHWKLVVLGKPSCPDDLLGYLNPPGVGPVGGRYTICDQWHTWSLAWIKAHHPDLLVISQQAVPSQFTPAQWKAGLARTLAVLRTDHQHTVILGNIPIFNNAPPACLAVHTDDVQACATSPVSRWTPYNQVERTEAKAAGVAYITPTSWFCTSTCSPVIGHYEVYLDSKHITAVYAQYLSTVLGQALAPDMAHP